MLTRLRWVAELLERDAQTDLTPLHERDREVAARVRSPRSLPHRQILEWAAIRDPDGQPEDGAARHVPGLVLAALGLLLGIAAAAAALYFEGGGRVNVVALLALLVGLQLISVLLTLIGMLPTGVRRNVPGLDGLGEALGLLSPAKMALGTLRRILPRAADSLVLLAADTARNARLFARARRWHLWQLSQGFALAFNLGILACFMAMVVFTDLAFGWSTTLEVAPSTVHRISTGAAAPWSWLLPQAVPSMDVVEASRFFRSQAAENVDPLLLGQWWPFVLAALVCYGLLPRFALWLFSRWRRARAERWTVLHLPGASELVYRLNTELVTTHDAPEAPAEDVERELQPSLSVAPASGSCTLIVWGDFDRSSEELTGYIRAASALDPVELLHAGGTRSPGHDRCVIDDAAAATRPVAIAVKSWEPPLADLTDFLEELRGFCRESQALVVVPVPQRGRSVSERSDVAVWRARIGRLGDPWLSVRASSGVADP